jgi:hypothetical protein
LFSPQLANGNGRTERRSARSICRGRIAFIDNQPLGVEETEPWPLSLVEKAANLAKETLRTKQEKEPMKPTNSTRTRRTNGGFEKASHSSNVDRPSHASLTLDDGPRLPRGAVSSPQTIRNDLLHSSNVSTQSLWLTSARLAAKSYSITFTTPFVRAQPRWGALGMALSPSTDGADLHLSWSRVPLPGSMTV